MLPFMVWLYAIRLIKPTTHLHKSVKGRLILGITLPIFSLVITVALFLHFMPISEERVQRATERVDESQFNLIGLCYDLRQIQNRMLDEYGFDSEEFEQFNKNNKDNFDACQEGLERIKQACKEQPNLKSCSDPRL